MMRNRFWRLAGMWVAVAAICAFAFGFRSARLEERVMHGDEANQAVRAGALLDEGVYHYDPTDHHGPVMYYAALPFCKATAKTFADTTEWNFRMVPVAFSLLTLVLMMGLYASDRRGLFAHPVGVLTAILLTAFSPAMNYYSRFFIQESMFVTFLTGMLVCAVQYVRAGGGTRRGAWLAGGFGVCLGLAAATKETVVLSVAAAGVAALCACGFRRLLAAWNTRDFLIMLGAAVLVMVLFFSSFFTYWQGLYDAVFSTVGAYSQRAVVEDHRNPWDFYLKLLFWHRYGPPFPCSWETLKGVLSVTGKLYTKGLVWSEAGMLILPALVALVAAFAPRRKGAQASQPVSETACTGWKACAPLTRWLRFLAVYTLALTALYSAIPYKTPWCMLSFLHGYILLAGAGVGLLCEWLTRLPLTWRWMPLAGVAVFVAYAAYYQGTQSKRACLTLAADIRNPYVYAHTRQDVLELVNVIEEAARKADGLDTLIAVAAPPEDTWPLPWYLRKYTRVGYWKQVEEIPAGVEPGILIVGGGQRNTAYDRFGEGRGSAGFGYNIRPGVLLNLFLPAPKTE